MNCGKAKTYNVKKFEKMRDGQMSSSQDFGEKDNTPPVPEESKEAQGITIIHTLVILFTTLSKKG